MYNVGWEFNGDLEITNKLLAKFYLINIREKRSPKKFEGSELAVDFSGRKIVTVLSSSTYLYRLAVCVCLFLNDILGVVIQVPLVSGWTKNRRVEIPLYRN